MKKAVVLLVLAASVMMAVSCRSLGRNVNDETFRRIYDRYAGQLILDGASRYTVRSGDTLVGISQSFYGSGFYYPVIMLASRDVVLDPDKIQPGMVLIVPDLQRNLNNPGSRAAMKGVIQDCVPIERSRGRPDTAEGLRQLAQSL